MFAVHAYYLNNLIRTYREKNQEEVAIHRENFEKSIKCTNIIEILSQKNKSLANPVRKFFIDEEFSSNKSIRPGSREDAFVYAALDLFYNGRQTQFGEFR